jgi:hypothetical protein
MSHQQALPTSRRLIPFACAGDAAGMHTKHHIQAAGGADPEALDDQVAEMDRGVANEAGRELPLPAPARSARPSATRRSAPTA